MIFLGSLTTTVGGGVSQICLEFSPLATWGRWTQFDKHFFCFKWVGSDTNYRFILDQDLLRGLLLGHILGRKSCPRLFFEWSWHLWLAGGNSNIFVMFTPTYLGLNDEPIWRQYYVSKGLKFNHLSQFIMKHVMQHPTFVATNWSHQTPGSMTFFPM